MTEHQVVRFTAIPARGVVSKSWEVQDTHDPERRYPTLPSKRQAEVVVAVLNHLLAPERLVTKADCPQAPKQHTVPTTARDRRKRMLAEVYEKLNPEATTEVREARDG